MRKFLAVSVATATVLTSALSTEVVASVHYNLTPVHIDFNGNGVSQPQGLVSNNTMYVPIWYIENALKGLGITSSWDGRNWHLTTPTGVKPDLTNIHSGTGTDAIYVNGTLVQRINSITYIDPSTKHNTTYMPIWYVKQILKRISFDSSWDGSKWGIVSKDVEMNALTDALSNTNGAANQQLSGTISMDMTLNLTDKGKQDLTGIPKIDLEMKLEVQTGTVQGEKATLVTITPVKDTMDTTMPPAVEVYVQGSNEWENAGSGWQVVSRSNMDSTQLMQSQLPEIQQAMLANVVPQVLSNGYQFNSQLNLSAADPLVNQILSSMPTQSGSSDASVTPAQLQAILQNTTGTIQLNVAPVNGKNYVTNEQVHLTMTIPASVLFTGTDETSQQMLQDVSGITLNETMNSAITFNASQITPPAGLPNSSGSSTSTTATTGN